MDSTNLLWDDPSADYDIDSWLLDLDKPEWPDSPDFGSVATQPTHEPNPPKKRRPTINIDLSGVPSFMDIVRSVRQCQESSRQLPVSLAALAPPSLLKGTLKTYDFRTQLTARYPSSYLI
jgi:hypothetical protein